jgi:hypothetical protein
MKIRNHHTLLLLAIEVFLMTSSTGKAEDFRANYGLKFDAGIGFYVVSDGIPYALTWAKNIKGQINESDISEISTNAQFYSYGLDFSVGAMAGPQPPHLLGYGLSYMDTNGNFHGMWAARFVPVSGYDQKVYRIVFEGPYDDLKNDTFQYHFWAFNVPGDNQGYPFHFKTSKSVEEQKELQDFISKVLSNKDKVYNGTVTVSLDPQTILQVSPFQIQFSSYDEKTGIVNAKVSYQFGKTDYTGQLLGTQQLTLKQVPGDNSIDSTWNLQFIGQNKLVYLYNNGGNSVKVEITLQETSTK